MTNQQLSGHLVKGIELLKGIREENAKQNERIDKYLEELLKALKKDEDKKKEEEEKKKKDDGGGEKPDPKETDAARKDIEEEKKMERAMKELEKMLEREKLTKEKKLLEKAESLAESMGKTMGGTAEVGIDDGSTGEPAGTFTPRTIIRKERSVAVESDGHITEPGSVDAPEIIDQTTPDPEGIWCEVCGVYHKDGEM